MNASKRLQKQRGKAVTAERVTAAELRSRLRACANPADAAVLQGFFKTGPGEYGEGDVFLGVRVPVLRKLVRTADGLRLGAIRTLLHSRFHEERLLALLIWVRRFERGNEAVREQVFAAYVRESRWINNWDLVDLSAPNIVGAWLLRRPRGLVDRWVRSRNLWERRIAVLSTFAWIRQGEFDDTLRLCAKLMTDSHDLIHKACGWMLREVGKRDVGVLEAFLDRHASTMPRTMLRYAIERMSAERRAEYLKRVRP